MAFGRWVLAVGCLSLASGAGAVVPGNHAPARLTFNLASLGINTGVTYRPIHWLAARARALIVNVTHGTAISRAAQDRPRLKGYALTGDIHPFGDGLRVSGGFREDGNRRLLRTSTEAELPTRNYAPVVTVGYAGEAVPGLTIGGDVGMVFPRGGIGGDTLVMPTDLMARQTEARRTPLFQLSAGYRF